MKNLVLFFLVFIMSVKIVHAQEESFSATVNNDSILLGNYFEIKFTIKNLENASFKAPDFTGFKIVGGPNQASSINIVNGAMTQSMTYSYFLEPEDIGNYFVEPAAVEVNGKYLETQPIEIIVVPNPDGIIQQPKQEKQRSFFDWGEWPDRFSPEIPVPQVPEDAPKPKKPKKKKKVYKI